MQQVSVNEDVKIVQREKWGELIIRKSLFSVLVKIFAVELTIFLFIGSITGILYLIAGPSNVPNIIIPLIIILIFLGIINVLLIIFVQRRTESSYYVLKSGHYKLQAGVADSTPSSIHVVTGYLFERLEIYPISEFEHVSYTQNFVEKIFNSGNILVTRKQSKPSLRMTNIVSPEKFVPEIENMIANEGGFQVAIQQ